MHIDFWHQKWQKNEIGFHLPEANPLLITHFTSLSLNNGSRVFLPLCGKTLDIAWLLEQGYRVVGAELSEIAIQDLFKNLGLIPTICQLGEITHYSSPNLDIFVGDIFHLSSSMLGDIDAVYDRAALVALPVDVRKTYAAHLIALTSAAPQLLICFEYDQTIQAGPPFSIGADGLRQYYGARYDLTLLASVDVVGGLKGKCTATEHVWHLQPLNQR